MAFPRPEEEFDQGEEDFIDRDEPVPPTAIAVAIARFSSK